MSGNNFTFSIIMAIYNTEQYLSEAIDSIINQTFGLDKIQIILVNDGSTDKSKEICDYYIEKYPENIFYLYQHNQGQSVARNNGLKIAKGRYVNFLDSDDKLNLNTLEDVYNLFLEFDDLIDVTVIPRHNFGIVNGPTFLNYKFKTTRIVDIYEEYDFPQHSISAAFIRRSAISENFNPNVIISEDALLINKIILKKCKYGVVSTAKYLYRKRVEQNSTIDTKKFNKLYFIPRMNMYFLELIKYSILKYGKVIKYVQSVLMYDLQWILRDNTHSILNKDEFNMFYSLILEILQYIDDDIILSQKFLDSKLEYFVMNMKYDNPNFNLIYNSKSLLLTYNHNFFDDLTDTNIVITDIYSRQDLLYIKGFFDTYFEGFKINAYHNDMPLNLAYLDGDEIYSINHQVSNRVYFATVLKLFDGNNKILFKIQHNSKEYSVPLKDNSFNTDISIKNNSLNFNFNGTSENVSSYNLIKTEIDNIFKLLIDSNKKMNITLFEKEILNINIVPKVSIIIPVFNPGNLLYDCLDSVINQSLKEIEIICVNDGSTDDSINVLEYYAKNDNRIKVFHQMNQGAGTARNKGIENSTGEYILFLDSDDWIDKDMCKKLYNQSEKLKTDLIIFDVLWHTKDGNVSEFTYFANNEFKDDFKSFSFDYKFIKNKLMIGSLGIAVCKFYKSSFIKENNIKFPKHKIYNDVEFHFKAILLANKMGYCPEPFYHYIRLGQPSLQTSFREGKDELVWFDVLDGLYNVFIENNLMDELRLDFINYCIYYTFDKLKNIETKYKITFLDKLKIFFSKLNPTDTELKELKSKYLTWYSRITSEYIPLYYDLIRGDLETFNFGMLKFRIRESKENLDKCNIDSKDEFYNELRRNFINLKLNSEILKKMPLDLFKFYISVINFESYYNYDLFNKNISQKNMKYIDKRKLSVEIENFNQKGINLKKREKLIIVSLTSFPDRIYDIHYCLYSLLTQDLKPDKVILWLAEEQFPNKEDDLTDEVINLKKNGLIIKWCNDIKPYKKLIPVLKEYPEDFIVTADDDIFYPKCWLKNIWEQHLKTPDAIISSRARKINFTSDGLIDEYNNWNLINSYAEPSYLNFPTGAGGTLYCPDSLCDKVHDEKLFLDLCPNGDDIWFWAMAVLNKSKIVVVQKPLNDLIYINLARQRGILNEITLWSSNKDGKNDIQIQNVINQFPEILSIIKDDD